MDDAVRERLMGMAQGALTLDLAGIGVVNRLLPALDQLGEADAATLAAEAGLDAGYVARWADAAFAVELLDREGDSFRVGALGAAFLPGDGSLEPMALGHALRTHMARRAAECMRTGERPGEVVLGESETVAPWFGHMLEASFSPMLRRIRPEVPALVRLAAGPRRVLDLACGNGWYLRALAAENDALLGFGLDGFSPNIADARARAGAAGMADRLEFVEGDVLHARPDGDFDLVAMNRALHHVWPARREVLGAAARCLRPGGAVAVWEPVWPSDPTALRQPPNRPLAFQNLAEHVQGNHFLHPDEVAGALADVGLAPSVFPFVDGREVVVVGTRI